MHSEAVKRSLLRFGSAGLPISNEEQQSRADAQATGKMGIESISNCKEPKTVLNLRFGSLAFAPFVSKLLIDSRMKP